MPITQSRMIELLDAAQDYRRACSQIIDIAQAENDRVATGKATLQESYEYLVTNMNPLLLLHSPTKSELTIILEAKHFKKFQHQNTRKAEKLRENREADRLGIPRPDRGQTSAPRSIRDIPAPTTQSPHEQITTPTSPEAQARLDRANAAMDEGGDEMSFGADTTAEVVAPTPTVPDDEMAKLLALHEKDTYGETYGAGAKPKTEQE